MKEQRLGIRRRRRMETRGEDEDAENEDGY